MDGLVVVTGVGGPAGRAAAEWFARRGLDVVGADMREVSSPATRFRRIAPVADPGFPSALLALLADHPGALLVPTVSEELPIVARLRPEIRARGCALAMGSAPGVEIAGDKLRTAQALASRRVSAPRTFAAGTPAAELVAALGLPLLAKPRVGRGGRGVRVLRSVEDVAGASGAELVFQEFVPGDEFDVNLFVERAGEVAAAVVLRKTALRDGETGNAAGVERIEHPGVRDEAIRAARALELAGPLDVDVRLRRDGAPAILEVNARLGANALSAAEVLDSLHNAWRAGRCN
ncbi:MAG TPA: ATP-grasp domain-containing protein [Anaeromyxobacter sp.]|nr:ATP-grasp domain-containing protein [Anaeromyxobacter sp.]